MGYLKKCQPILFSRLASYRGEGQIKLALLFQLCDSVTPLVLTLRTSEEKQIYLVSYDEIKTSLFFSIPHQ